MKPVRNLDPVPFDFADGRADRSAFSKAAAPVRVLPTVTFDLAQPGDLPALQLTLELQPEADSANVALDVLSLIDSSKTLND